jgi:RNA polymerase sigma factor (sigma-70 family)
MYDERVELYEKNTRFAIYLAASWLEKFPYELRDDLFGEARVGLWKACMTFNPSRGVKFTTYAGRVITTTILQFREKNKNIFHIHPESLQEDSGQSDDSLNARHVDEEIGYDDNFDGKVFFKIIVESMRTKYPTLYLYLLKGLTQTKIGQMQNKTRAAISQRIKKEKVKLIKEFQLNDLRK